MTPRREDALSQVEVRHAGPPPGVSAALSCESVAKRYGGVQALLDVSIDLYPGETVGLVGDNGAGKSTLVRLLSGVEMPDAGRLKVAGEPVRFASPSAARAAGVETVYQDLALASHLSVAANIFLGRELARGGILGRLRFLDEARMRRAADESLKTLRITIPNVGRDVERLSGGQRQAVAVARATIWGKRVVILDEPTAALGVEETAMVLRLVERVSSQGAAVLFISHTLPQIFEVTDRIVVLRLGRVVASARTRDCTPDQVVSWITGASEMSLKRGR